MNQIDEFKALDKKYNALKVMTSPIAANLCVAWTMFEAEFKPVEYPKSIKSLKKKWEFLWEHTEFSVVELCKAAEVSPLIGAPIINALIENRVIFPDGTISQGAEMYLNSTVYQKVTGKRPTPKPKKETEKEINDNEEINQ